MLVNKRFKLRSTRWFACVPAMVISLESSFELVWILLDRASALTGESNVQNHRFSSRSTLQNSAKGTRPLLPLLFWQSIQENQSLSMDPHQLCFVTWLRLIWNRCCFGFVKNTTKEYTQLTTKSNLSWSDLQRSLGCTDCKMCRVGRTDLRCPSRQRKGFCSFT